MFLGYVDEKFANKDKVVNFGPSGVYKDGDPRAKYLEK